MTASTTPTRSANASAAGISYGIFASAIFFLARTIFCAVVASGSTKARAISRVESPHSVRNASAAWADQLQGRAQRCRPPRSHLLEKAPMR